MAATVRLQVSLKEMYANENIRRTLTALADYTKRLEAELHEVKGVNNG